MRHRLRIGVCWLFLIASIGAFSSEEQSIYIVGGGIVGLLEAYHAFDDARKAGKPISITVFEKNQSLSETPASNIFPSLTPDEILAVIPRGQMLVKDLGIPFNKGDGIRIDDVPEVDLSSPQVKQFVAAAQQFGEDDKKYQSHVDSLFDLGKESMHLWDLFYQQADDALKQALILSNYKPCKEVATDEKKLGEGYRIDLLHSYKTAKKDAMSMMNRYQSLGYKATKLLSPDEVIQRDPTLKSYVLKYSVMHKDKGRMWARGACAIWRPGGCLNAHEFMPKLIAYLEQQMNKDKLRFQVLFDHKVVKAGLNSNATITQLEGESASKQRKTFVVNPTDQVIFVPGEAVGTLEAVGFKEPYHAIFAGPSLTLTFPVTDKTPELLKTLDHCMEIRQKGVVLAWQAKCVGEKITIGIGGTKAFYAQTLPKNSEAFARNRHVLQLNEANNLYPALFSEVLNKPTTGKRLSEKDLNRLINNNIASVWVGARAVAYDGYPTLGKLYKDNKVVTNARTTTHLGSGGVSFAHGSIMMSKRAMEADNSSVKLSSLENKVIHYSDSRR